MKARPTDLCPRCHHAWGHHCVPVKDAAGKDTGRVTSSTCRQRGPDGRAPVACGCAEPTPYAEAAA